MTLEAEIQPRPSVDDTGEKRFISDRTMREGADGLENVPSLEGGRPLPQNSSASSESRDATNEEFETLAHVTDDVPFAAWAVIFAGAAERFTYFGLIAPWRELVLHSPALETRLIRNRELHAEPSRLSCASRSSRARAVDSYKHLQCLFPLFFLDACPVCLGIGHLAGTVQDACGRPCVSLVRGGNRPGRET